MFQNEQHNENQVYETGIHHPFSNGQKPGIITNGFSSTGIGGAYQKYSQSPASNHQGTANQQLLAGRTTNQELLAGRTANHDLFYPQYSGQYGISEDMSFYNNHNYGYNTLHTNVYSPPHANLFSNASTLPLHLNKKNSAIQPFSTIQPQPGPPDLRPPTSTSITDHILQSTSTLPPLSVPVDQSQYIMTPRTQEKQVALATHV